MKTRSKTTKTAGDWMRCPRCGSKHFLFNKKTLTYWCRRCGCQFILNFGDEHAIELTPKYIRRKGGEKEQ